jgi:hypothetical protein
MGYGIRIPFRVPPRRLPRCGAKAKSTGLPCRRYVRRGWNRCVVHGAGSKVRVRSGRRLPPGRIPAHVIVSVIGTNTDRVQPRTFECEFGQIRAWGGTRQVASTSSPPHRKRLKTLSGCRVCQDNDLEYNTIDFDRVWQILNTDYRD